MISSCETCNGPQQELKRKMIATLERAGVDPADFLSSNHQRRFNLLVDGFALRGRQTEHVTKVDREDGRGLLIIKPEMIMDSLLVHNFLESVLGMQILQVQRFVYSPETYWEMQGCALNHRLDQIPHASLLFLLSTTEPSEAILFQHLTPKQYRERFQCLNPSVSLLDSIVFSDDSQEVFTHLFVRYSGKISLRDGVCQARMSARGFLEMKEKECPATCWDFTGFYGHRDKTHNLRTFNGVHSPSNKNELFTDLSILGNLFS